MDFEPFLREYYSGLPDDRYKNVVLFCDNVNNILGNKDIKDVCNNKTTIYSLFYISGDRSISKAQFFKVKGYVKSLYEWLMKIGVANKETYDFIMSLTMGDVISDGELLIYYFANLQEILNFVTTIGDKCGLSEKDDLLNIKATVILSWYGLSIEEMIQIRKTDINHDDCTVQIHSRSGKQPNQIQLNKSDSDILWRFSLLDKHAGFPSGKVQNYKDSPYLFRSARQEQMEPNNIACSFKRFNEISSQYGKRLSFTALQKNGLFCKVLESEESYKTVGIAIKSLKNCDKAFAFGYKFSYDKWKSIYAIGR